MSKFKIKEILNCELIIPEIEVLEYNIPSPIRVTEKEYRDFLNKNEEHIGESYSVTVSDTYVVKDKYGNIIARVYFYMENEFYINPELLYLGINKKILIKNKTRQIGEKRIDLGAIKPCNLDCSNVVKR